MSNNACQLNFLRASPSLLERPPRFYTPVGQISRFKIGSRPSRRKAGSRIEDLRAIPWVFSWTQSRHLLPGWYPFGSAVEHFLKRHPRSGQKILREMARKWSFFAALTDLVQMTLAKADMRLAGQYAALFDKGREGKRIFETIRREHQKSREMILAITGQKALLEKQYMLQDAIPRRNPSIDQIHTLQVLTLKGIREKGRRISPAEIRMLTREIRMLTRTFNEIAAGMKNTG